MVGSNIKYCMLYSKGAKAHIKIITRAGHLHLTEPGDYKVNSQCFVIEWIGRLPSRKKKCVSGGSHCKYCLW